MQNLIIHHTASNIEHLREGLKYDNIDVIRHHWNEEGRIDSKLFETNAVTLYLDENGTGALDYIQRVNSKCPEYPIIVVDGRNKKSRPNVKEFLHHEYFAEPIAIRDVSLKLKKLVCTMQMPKSDQWLKAYDLWLDLEHHYAKRNERIIPLRNREFALLEFFIINQGKVLTRSSILEFVWDRNSDLTSNTVDVHVNRLRRKIDEPFGEKLIHTIPYVGYKFEKREHVTIGA